MVDGRVALTTELPDAVVAIGDAAAAGKDRTITLLAHVVVAEVAVGRVPGGPRADGVVLVVGLGVQSRFDGLQRIVPFDHLPDRRAAPGAMAGLHHVQVEPRLVVQLFGGRVAAPRMIGLEGVCTRAFVDARGHGAPDGPVVGIVFVRGPVAAENPENVGAILVALAQPAAIETGIIHCEDLRACPPHGRHFVGPGRQEADIETFGRRRVDDQRPHAGSRLHWGGSGSSSISAKSP